MNEAQRKVLRNHRGEILDNLIVDDSLLSSLLEKDILTEHLYQLIKGRMTDNEKVGELLYILPKRGPGAFQGFIESIRKSADWLADTLESSCTEWENILLKTEYTAAKQVTEVEAQPEVPTSENETDMQQENEPVVEEEKENNTIIPNKTLETSENKGITEEIETPKDTPREKPRPVPRPRHSPSIHTGLNNIYTKLKTRLYCKNIRELSFSSPEPASCEMISQLLDELFINLDDVERTINQCYALIGGRDKNYPLVSRIIDLQNSKSALESDMKMKEQQKNKYGDHISKLENRCRNQATEISQLKDEIQRMKDELTSVNAERDEKQTMIDDLRKLINETTKNQKGRASHMSLVSLSGLAEIKQLKDEIKKLRVENQSLKKINAENLVYLKSENLKKLSKMRETEEEQPKIDSYSVPQGHSKYRSRHVHVDKSANNQVSGPYEQSIKEYMDKNLDKQYQNHKPNFVEQPSQNGVLKDRTRQSIEEIYGTDEIVRVKRSNENRKERKRVTFSTGYSSHDDITVGKDDSEKQELEANFRAAMSTVTNTTNQVIERGQTVKQTKGVRGRLKKSENKPNGRRSASTSSVPSIRDVPRTQVVHRNRGYRQNVSHW